MTIEDCRLKKEEDHIVKFTRITVNPDQMGGVPCIRGLRIPVATVVKMVADGMSEEEILKAYPDLELEDLREALRYATEAIQSKGNYVEANYSEYANLYLEATNFYKEQFRSLEEVKGSNIVNLLPEVIIIQFCFICYQGLVSVFHLLQRKEFFIPLLIVRNMLEYSITWAYIERDPETRANQYANDGLRIQLKLITAAKDHPNHMDPEHLQRLIQREPQFQTEYDQAQNRFGAWVRELSTRADKAGLIHMYDIDYRLLSLYSHPDSNTSNYFFTDLPNGTIDVHEYNKDDTETVLHTALKETNILMSILNDRLKLPSQEKYDKLREKINQLAR